MLSGISPFPFRDEQSARRLSTEWKPDPSHTEYHMRFVILHYHIFKNAGTAIGNLLKLNFGERFSEFEGDGPDCQLSGQSLVAWLEQHPEVQAVSSHQLRY